MAAWGFYLRGLQQAVCTIPYRRQSGKFPAKPDFPKAGKGNLNARIAATRPRTSESIWLVCSDDSVQFSVCRIAGISSSHNFALSNILTALITSLFFAPVQARRTHTSNLRIAHFIPNLISWQLSFATVALDLLFCRASYITQLTR